MRKLFIILLLLLAGCGSLTPQKETITVERIIYPELPPVPSIPALQLENCIFDRPRMYWSDLVVISDTQCKAELKADPTKTDNPQFQKTCMEFPIDTESNIIIGFDDDGRQCFILNREKIRQHIYLYQQRIEEVNRQRKEWIERNVTKTE